MATLEERLALLITQLGTDWKAITDGSFLLDLNIAQNRDTGSVTKWRTDFTGTLTTSVGNVFEHYVNGTLRSWANEWGALRGRTPYTNYADALVRAIIESGDYIGLTGNGGNAIEIVDRTLPATVERQVYGRRWNGGRLVRKGVEVTEEYVWTVGDADPTSGGTVALPVGAVWVIRIGLSDSVPSWTPTGSVIRQSSVWGA